MAMASATDGSDQKLSSLECAICFEKYESGVKIPKVMNCGHTFCEQCVNSMISDYVLLKTNRLGCPICRFISIAGQAGYPANMVRLNLLEDDGRPVLRKIDDVTFHLYFTVRGAMKPNEEYVEEMQKLFSSQQLPTSAVWLFRAAQHFTEDLYGIRVRLFAEIVSQGLGKPLRTVFSVVVAVDKYFQARGQINSQDCPGKYSYKERSKEEGGGVSCTIKMDDIDNGATGCEDSITLEDKFDKIVEKLIGMQHVTIETKCKVPSKAFGPSTSVTIDFGNVPVNDYIRYVKQGQLPFCGKWWIRDEENQN